MSLRQRPLGKTGLVVSELSLGTWGISGDAYGPVLPAEAERTIARALDMGVTLFDTADSYGGGQMEALLGRAVRGKNVTVVTKCGTDRTTEPARKHFDPEYVRSRVEASLKRLGSDHVDLYLLDHPSTSAVALGEATTTMDRLKTEGKILHWGVAAGDAEVARVAIDKGAEVVELAYNLLNPIELHRVAGDVMVSGAGVLVRSALSYGLLAGTWKKDRDFPPADHRANRWTKLELERRIGQLDAVRFLVKGDVHTLRGAAIRFVLANHLVSSCVLGAKSITQLDQLVRETGAGPRYLPDDDLATLPRALARVGVIT